MNFTLFQLQGNIIVGDDTGKALGNAEHFNCKLFHVSSALLLCRFLSFLRF